MEKRMKQFFSSLSLIYYSNTPKIQFSASFLSALAMGGGGGGKRRVSRNNRRAGEAREDEGVVDLITLCCCDYNVFNITSGFHFISFLKV